MLKTSKQYTIESVSGFIGSLFLPVLILGLFLKAFTLYLKKRCYKKV